MRHSRTRIQPKQGNRRRAGVVILELIVWFPILIIVLLAVTEIGLILAADKHVEFASRLGAKLAAESPPMQLGMLNDGGPLKSQIDEYLNSAGYSNSCTVILEHNVMAASNPLQLNPSPAGCNCGPVGSLPALVPAPPDPNIPVQSVRVTVCLPMDGNIPNCLSTFGFDLADCTIQQSVVWRYEVPSSP